MNKKVLLIVTIAGVVIALGFTGLLLYKKFSVTPAVDESEVLSPIITAEWMDPQVLSADPGITEASVDPADGVVEPVEVETEQIAEQESTEIISTEIAEPTEPTEELEIMDEAGSIETTEASTEKKEEPSTEKKEEPSTEKKEEPSSEKKEPVSAGGSSSSTSTSGSSSESRTGTSGGMDVMQDVSSNGELLCEAESGTDLMLADNINKQLKALPSKSYRVLSNNGWRVVLTKEPISSRFQMPSGMHAMVYPSHKTIYYDNTDASNALVNQGVATAIMVINGNPQNGAEFKALYDKEGANMDPGYGVGTQAFFNFVFDKMITNPDMINASCPETAKYIKRYM